MGDLAAVVLVVTVSVVLMAAILSGMVFGRLRRANRVSPGTDTGAPLHWLVWPFPIVSLHRRLRAAIVVARSAAPPPPPRSRRRRVEPTPLAEIAMRLEAHAAELDRELVLAAHRPGASRVRIVPLALRQVLDIERLANRISVLARADGPLPSGRTNRLRPFDPSETLLRVHEDLFALEAAHDEIARIEATALGRPPVLDAGWQRRRPALGSLRT